MNNLRITNAFKALFTMLSLLQCTSGFNTYHKVAIVIEENKF